MSDKHLNLFLFTMCYGRFGLSSLSVCCFDVNWELIHGWFLSEVGMKARTLNTHRGNNTREKGGKTKGLVRRIKFPRLLDFPKHLSRGESDGQSSWRGTQIKGFEIEKWSQGLSGSQNLGLSPIFMDNKINTPHLFFFILSLRLRFWVGGVTISSLLFSIRCSSFSYDDDVDWCFVVSFSQVKYIFLHWNGSQHADKRSSKIN